MCYDKFVSFSDNNRRSRATLIGYISLLMWASSGVLTSSVTKIPTFEVLSVAFAISFGITAATLTVKKQWHKVKQPWPLWVAGVIGIFGNDALYVAAFKYAPPAQADLISYLYPLFIIFLASFLPGEKLLPKYIIAALLGLLGTYLLITKGHGLSSFHVKYSLGYVFAILNAIAWSVYCIVARYFKNTPSEMVGVYCGCGLLLSLLFHFGFEHTVIPNTTELLTLIAMGLTTQGSAYFLWDYGIKKGNFKFLSIIAYGNPIIAVFLLVITGKSHYSDILMISTMLIAASGAIAGIKFTSFKKALSLFAEA